MESSRDPRAGALHDALSSLSPEARKAAYDKHFLVSTPISVFQESPSQPVEFFVPGKPTGWPGPLLAICRELDPQDADNVFYGRNHFHLVDTSTDREVAILDAFLTSITPRCARLLRHLSLSFPALEAVEGQPQAIGLREAGLRSLRLLQVNCANLMTLELSVHNGNAFGLNEESPQDPLSFQAVCSQISQHFRAIETLDRIVVRYYQGKPTSSVRQLMQDSGWIVLFGHEKALQ